MEQPPKWKASELAGLLGDSLSMKKCKKCQQTKPLSAFNKYKKNKDGLHGHCQECRVPGTEARRAFRKERAEMKERGFLWCSQCEKYKPLAEWRMPKEEYRKNWRPTYCKECTLAWQREYRTKNKEHINSLYNERRKAFKAAEPEVAREKNRESNLRLMYGISVDEYEEILSQQGGVCGVCGKPPVGRRLAVDHDHRCCPGKKACRKCIRGLLCGSCNPKLGWFEIFEEEATSWRDRRVFTTVKDVK